MDFNKDEIFTSSVNTVEETTQKIQKYKRITIKHLIELRTAHGVTMTIMK